jgi:hypothetical protein
MSLFESIEFFFAKDNTTIIPFDLNTKEAPKKVVIQPHKAPVQREQQPSFLPKKKEVKVPVTTIKKEAESPKKDHFYTEWEKKYRELHAENLLAKKPFKKHALFVVDEKAPKAFAEKIAGAINTRLMKTTFIVSNASIESLIKEYDPSHIITTKEVSTSLPLLLIDDLKGIEKDPIKKKVLWEEIKSKIT